MELKPISFNYKVLPFLSIFFLVLGISPVHAQYDKPNSVMQSANEAAEQINKVGDEAKAKYAENIDKPYIPVKVNPEYNTEEVKTLLTRVLKKYVNYYNVSKVPAYRNVNTNLIIKKIRMGKLPMSMCALPPEMRIILKTPLQFTLKIS